MKIAIQLFLMTAFALYATVMLRQVPPAWYACKW